MNPRPMCVHLHCTHMHGHKYIFASVSFNFNEGQISREEDDDVLCYGVMGYRE